jgi:DNA uptake protein ComE-like DNA-binding protein
MNWLRQLKLRKAIEQNPYYRLQSSLEIAMAAKLGLKINVNYATVDQWLRISILSIHQARNLVELSRMGVQFLSLEDIAAALNITLSQIEPFESILYFAYYAKDNSLTSFRLDVNQASLSQLESIYLLDQNLAQSIIDNRETRGRFETLADLQSRLNLNGELMSQLIHFLYC